MSHQEKFKPGRNKSKLTFKPCYDSAQIEHLTLNGFGSKAGLVPALFFARVHEGIAP